MKVRDKEFIMLKEYLPCDGWVRTKKLGKAKFYNLVGFIYDVEEDRLPDVSVN